MSVALGIWAFLDIIDLITEQHWYMAAGWSGCIAFIASMAENSIDFLGWASARDSKGTTRSVQGIAFRNTCEESHLVIISLSS